MAFAPNATKECWHGKRTQNKFINEGDDIFYIGFILRWYQSAVEYSEMVSERRRRNLRSKSARRLSHPLSFACGSLLGSKTVVNCALSALGHKQTYAPQEGMSALPPIADMCGALEHVRFGPIADSCTAANAPLFD
jgi:hypothetical protein